MWLQGKALCRGRSCCCMPAWQGPRTGRILDRLLSCCCPRAYLAFRVLCPEHLHMGDWDWMRRKPQLLLDCKIDLFEARKREFFASNSRGAARASPVTLM